MDLELIIKYSILFMLVAFFILRARFTRHYKEFTYRTTIKYFVFIFLIILYFGNFFEIGFFEIPLFIRFVLGLGFIFIGMMFFFWSHFHLGNNWSPIIEKKFTKSRRFVKSGPYAYIRHPIYSSSFLTLFGLLIFSANWILAGIPFLILLLFYLYKIPLEERELVRNFGKKYKCYMKRTWRLFPKIL